ncbi:tetratricopeptide repeat protein [Paraburkholderia youngii]|uniref:tetratricopeptide repeat protein n=1 Tax=Paraburkholderia youngii TaxID=2782701 RepID=UPI003D1B0848
MQLIDQAKEARAAGESKKAVSILEPIVKKDPNNYSAVFNLGLAYMDLGETSDGIDALGKAKNIAIKEQLPDKQSINSYGWALLVSGDYLGANNAFKEAESRWSDLDDETKRKVLNNEGLTLTYMGRYSEAESYFKRAAQEFDSPLAKQNLKRVQELEKSASRARH